MTGIILSAAPTNFFLARCTACIRPVRAEVPNPPCPECGRLLSGERLFAVTRDQSCDGRCMGAVRPSCSCSCGGENHGKWFAYSTGEESEGAVKAYRTRVAKEQAKREQRQAAERRRARRAFEAWCEESEDRAEVLAYLSETQSDNEFVCEMARQVKAFMPLTERQEEAVRRCMAYERQRAEDAEHRAQQEANAKPVPTGKALTIEGVVVHTKVEDNMFGPGGSYKMLVVGDDGWKVWGTIPSSLHGRGTVGDPFGLKQKRVRFVADVKVKGDDQTFGILSRPRKAVTLS